MQTGIAVVILICITVLLVLLFYLVTRYFNYRLQKSLQNQNSTYSMIDGISINYEDLRDGEIQDFAQSRVQQWKKKDDERKKIYMSIAGMSGLGLKQELIQPNFNIYGKQKQQNQMQKQSFRTMPESSRSFGSFNNFGVQKLSDYRPNNSVTSDRNNSFSQDGKTNKNNKQNASYQQNYKYISQIVSFRDNEILIVKNVVTSIFKSNITEQIIEKRYILKKKIVKSDVHFLDTLEAYGFEEKIPGAYKFETIATIQNFKSEIHFTLKQYRQSQSKQQISLQQFNSLLTVLQQI